MRHLSTAWKSVLIVASLRCATLAPAAEPGRWVPTPADVRTGTNVGTGTSGFQIALWSPIQIFPSTYDIYGLRLDLPFGKNNSLYGIDFGGYNWTTSDTCGGQIGVVGNRAGNLLGVEIAAGLNWVDNEMVGCQIGLINRIDATGNGLQLGLYNAGGEDFGGMQMGAFNRVGNMRGVQIGIANACGTLYGVQLGLFNFVSKANYLNFCPIVNASF
jgi:hypothetical protein